MIAKRWTGKHAAVYITILLGAGLVLGLNRLVEVAWVADGFSIFSNARSLSQLLSLVFVYYCSVASSVAVLDANETRRVTYREIFLCSALIMILYMLQLAFFTEVAFVLGVSVVVYLLFVLWNYLRDLEWRDDLRYKADTTQSPYSISKRWNQITAAWVAPALLIFAVCTEWPGPSIALGGIVAAILLAISYRVAFFISA